MSAPRSTSRILALAGAIPFALAIGAGTAAASTAPSAPTSSDANGATPIPIDITAEGCAAPESEYPSGGLVFEVRNVDATAVTEFEVLSGDRILGEKENLPPGFSGSFSLQLGPGTYELYCPGADTERSEFTLVGELDQSAPTDVAGVLAEGADGYLGYVRNQVTEMQTAVAALDAAIQSGDVDAAKLAYIQARPFYERIEPVAESFVLGDRNLDAAIDLRADDVAPTDLEGFHRIEYGLWTEASTDGLADVSAQLVTDVASLQQLIDGLGGLQAFDLANGAVGLLDEAASGKITGEEERYSHIDLLDLAANVEGSEQAFAYLEEGLTMIDPDLVATIKERFAALDAVVQGLADPSEPSGFPLYDTLTTEQTRQLSDALQAVAEPLSQVAAKVVAA